MKINTIHTKNDRLMRGCGWTSNGYWMIESGSEPKALHKRQTTDELTSNMIHASFTRWLGSDSEPLTCVALMPDTELNGLKVKPVRVSKAGKIVYFNHDYIALLKTLDPDEFVINNRYSNMPIIAMKAGNPIGVVQPLNIQ